MADRGASPSDYSFGEFRLIPSRQLLLESEKPLHLGSRALEILTALVERAGEVVTKEEIIARVWPNTFIEDGNLRFHIAAIRQNFGRWPWGQSGPLSGQCPGTRIQLCCASNA